MAHRVCRASSSSSPQRLAAAVGEAGLGLEQPFRAVSMLTPCKPVRPALGSEGQPWGSFGLCHPVSAGRWAQGSAGLLCADPAAVRCDVWTQLCCPRGPEAAQHRGCEVGPSPLSSSPSPSAPICLFLGAFPISPSPPPSHGLGRDAKLRGFSLIKKAERAAFHVLSGDGGSAVRPSRRWNVSHPRGSTLESQLCG